MRAPAPQFRYYTIDTCCLTVDHVRATRENRDTRWHYHLKRGSHRLHQADLTIANGNLERGKQQ